MHKFAERIFYRKNIMWYILNVCVCTADHSSSVVSIQPSIADVQEGQSLELNCFAPGNPPPQVTWTRASGRLSSNHQVEQILLHTTVKYVHHCAPILLELSYILVKVIYILFLDL